MLYDTWKTTEPPDDEPQEHHYWIIRARNGSLPEFYTDDPEEAAKYEAMGRIVEARVDTLTT